MQKIPSRVEVLSWNENAVADLLREHKLLDCVDCIYQRHIDGQKLLNLKEGDVKYFLEIHNETSRGKFWNIIKMITEKKGGVQNLMRNFQGNSEWNNNHEVDKASENTIEYDDDSESDSFDSDYDEPEDEQGAPPPKPAISLERKETIRKKLLDALLPHMHTSHEDLHSDYPTPEDIYDMPEDGCGEPEDDELYDVPSDESGGGVVTRRPPLERKESDQYLLPDNTTLLELQETIDEDYEDLGCASPQVEPHDEQEDYVVPDTKPNTVVPPRPPKPSAETNNKPMPHRPLSTESRTPPIQRNTPPTVPSPPPTEQRTSPTKHKGSVNESKVQTLQAKWQEQVNLQQAPEPHRVLKRPPFNKPPPSVNTPTSGPSKTYLPKPDQQKAPAQSPRVPKKPIPEIPVEPEAGEDEYEFPEYPAPTTGKKPALKPPIVQEKLQPPLKPPPVTKKLNDKKPPPPVEPEQETYEPPDQPPRHPKKPAINHKPPVEIEQESYEAPETPVRPAKKLPAKPSVLEPAQENYEPPEPQRRKKPVISDVPADAEENYEAPSDTGTNSQEPEQEDYEIPDKPETPKEAPDAEPQVSPNKRMHLMKSLFDRIPSKKGQPKVDKKKPAATPPVPENKKPPSSDPSLPTSKTEAKTSSQRKSMALPSLPTDSVDSEPTSVGSISHSLPPKPLPGKPPKDRSLPARRPVPEVPPSKPPQKTKEQLLQDQPWFHSSISKPAVADMLKSVKKDGAYLVRNSSRDPGKFIMSISYKNDIRHLNIPCEGGHFRLGDSGKEKFKSIEELVSYFNTHDVEFSAGGKTSLTHACRKQS